MKQLTYNELTPKQKLLLDAAEQAMATAYAPYSKFSVGAGLLVENNVIVPGSNVENAAYGSTICAERSALLSANAQGYKSFTAIAVLARGETVAIEKPAAPCGACRQMLLEAAQRSHGNMEIIFSNTNKDNIIVTTIEDLLPYGFGPANL